MAGTPARVKRAQQNHMEDKRLPYEGSYKTQDRGDDEDNGLYVRLSSRMCQTFGIEAGDEIDVYGDYDNGAAIADLGIGDPDE